MIDSSAYFRLKSEKVIYAAMGTGKDTQVATPMKMNKLIRIGIEKSEGLMQTKANVTALHIKFSEKISESGI